MQVASGCGGLKALPKVSAVANVYLQLVGTAKEVSLASADGVPRAI